ncbi:uncharacterized protein LOC119453418 [Dermacentor silvarum]|uniref:uncharacterized protein LOC119453418 n=1 Tax=Dermacentor silvarum TaxID=543639 RepID=UPI00189971B5|nr:uncharacterized protein LOC119453418 [Dermacentor silvarum]
MAWHVSLAWLVAVSCFAATGEPDGLPFVAPSGVEQGERQYKAVLAKIPEYGACWSEAVARLERGCDELTEELQGRLALAFTSCFLEKMGQPPIRCPNSQPLSRCPALAQFLEKPLATSYTQFFTHTQVICAFLRSRKWQAEAARTITELGASSVRATAELRRAAETQAQLVRRQQQMFANTEHLRQELANAHSTLREHREMLDTSLLRLSYVQAFFVDQFATLHSLGYYAIAAVLAFLMTASKRTAGARPWLLLLFLINLLVERMIVKWASVDAIDRAAPLASDSPLGVHIGLSRRLVCLLALCVYLYQLYTFRDLASLNNQLLLDLQAEMRNLRTSQSPLGSPQQDQDPRTATMWRPPEESAFRWIPLNSTAAACLFTNHTARDSSDSSTESSESEESDAGMWSLDDWDDDYDYDDDNDNDNDSNDDYVHFSDQNSCASDNTFVETETKYGAGSSTERDSNAQLNRAASCVTYAAQSERGSPSVFTSPATSLAQAAPPSSVASPESAAAPNGGRYNLRSRRSLNSSSDPLSPPPSLQQRRDLALPRRTIERAAILSSDED